MRYLGLDLGRARIGLALADDVLRTARPLSVVRHRSREADLAAIVGRPAGVGGRDRGGRAAAQHGRDARARRPATRARSRRSSRASRRRPRGALRRAAVDVRGGVAASRPGLLREGPPRARRRRGGGGDPAGLARSEARGEAIRPRPRPPRAPRRGRGGGPGLARRHRVPRHASRRSGGEGRGGAAGSERARRDPDARAGGRALRRAGRLALFPVREARPARVPGGRVRVRGAAAARRGLRARLPRRGEALSLHGARRAPHGGDRRDRRAERARRRGRVPRGGAQPGGRAVARPSLREPGGVPLPGHLQLPPRGLRARNRGRDGRPLPGGVREGGRAAGART